MLRQTDIWGFEKYGWDNRFSQWEKIFKALNIEDTDPLCVEYCSRPYEHISYPRSLLTPGDLRGDSRLMRAALVGFWEALFVDRNLFTAATGEREREKKRYAVFKHERQEKRVFMGDGGRERLGFLLRRDRAWGAKTLCSGD